MLRNYTTKINVVETVAAIQHLLVRAGATAVHFEYDASREPSAIAFSITLDKHPLHFLLPRNTEGVMAALKRQGARATQQRPEHAARVSWRILLDWVGAQLAIIEAGQATTAQVFMPYALQAPGDTHNAYDAFRQSRLKQLGAGV